MRILIKAVAASHLFGLNTPTSDIDYKGVFIPELDEVLLGKAPKSIKHSTGNDHSKNTSEDVDTEFYSLSKFMKMLEEGQTVALELLFTPNEFIVEKDPLWDTIVAQRKHLVHKGVTAFIGYAKTQADRYDIRGSRMGSLEEVMLAFEKLPFDAKLAECNQQLNVLTDLDHVQWQEINNRTYFEVCNRKFELTTTVLNAYDTLRKIYDNYGERSRLAKINEGIDWKALSYALRVSYQGWVLLRTGTIPLPLPTFPSEFIKSVKLGKIPYDTVSLCIETWLENLKEAQETSLLPEKIDTSAMTLKLYKKAYNLGNNYE